jgi:hypothetical protein
MARIIAKYVTRSSSATPISTSQPNLHRTWQPTHGIVFSNSPGASPRLLSTAPITADVEQAILEQELGENTNWIDNYATFMGEKNAKAASSRPITASPPILDHTASMLPLVPGIKEESLHTRSFPEETVLDDFEQNELHRTTLPFKISEEAFRAAKEAEPGSSESYWSYTLYRGPGGEKVKVHYCKSKHTTERVLEEYFLDKKVIGFDIEWKADSSRSMGPKKNVSLIQIACEDRIALFHVALYAGDKLEDLVAPSLKKIMEDPNTTKVGVAIKGDCTRLRNHLDIHSRGIFELSHLHKLVKYSSSKDYKLINKKLVSLATQTQEHLHLPLFKGEVRGSDWSLPLALDQITYAASDSYAGVHLFDTMELKRLALDPVPPCPYHAEEEKPIRIAEGLEIPTDEEADAEEPEPPPTKRAQKKLSPSYLAKASESLELDPDFEVPLPETHIPTPFPTRSRPTSSKSTSAQPTASFKSIPEPKNPLIIAATLAAEKYRTTHFQNRASQPSLRCYFLWHENPELSLTDIAALLREVPLAKSTVVSYILDAIKFERVPYERERLKDVLGMLPEDIVGHRYKTLAKDCGIWETHGKA